VSINCDSVGAFLTAAALLAAILLLWLQLWERAVDRYKPKVTGCEEADKNKEEVKREFIPGLGIVWTYLAISCALAAFACAACACWIHNSPNTIPKVAVGFLSTAFLMTVVNVLTSLFSTLLKLKCTLPLSKPPFKIEEHERCCWFKCLLLGFVGLGLIGFSLQYECVGSLCGLISGGVLTLITIIFVLCKVRRKMQDSKNTCKKLK